MRSPQSVSSKRCRREVPGESGHAILLASAIVPLLVTAVLGVASLVS